MSISRFQYTSTACIACPDEMLVSQCMGKKENKQTKQPDFLIFPRFVILTLLSALSLETVSEKCSLCINCKWTTHYFAPRNTSGHRAAGIVAILDKWWSCQAGEKYEKVSGSSEGGRAEGWCDSGWAEMKADDPLWRPLKGTAERRRGPAKE